ncbi:helix-turn-helix transcriptional regulator [Nonomuraea sp. SBT364]|uniref:helix-turn-helix transcriptional regulator n=1 Tax=Nonomuraea sp. SBT364 TaxID=1580530 RepID=UPI00066E4D0C|nr:LuxR C-terminal-related transcriptional regulator [Nonomuraea sp. SBT364]
MVELPVIRDGLLGIAPGRPEIAVGTPQWRAWLTEAAAFAVEHPAGRFTVRWETSGNGRGTGYWRAHRRVLGVRRRVYLGGSDQVTANALDDAGHVLAAAASHGEPPEVTKLGVPPARAGAVARPQLYAALDRAARLPLTLVCAPAGSGKTTTLAAWAATTSARVAWLSLDRDDNDLVTFCRGFAAALDVTMPDTAIDSRPALRRRLAGLINKLAGRPGDLVLVLDDYHLIGSADLHDAVAHLVERLPPRIHLIIATRYPPPLPLATWRAKHRMCDLDAARLRFTTTETAAFLGETMGLRLGPRAVAGLHARTEGWPAGLQLAALAVGRGVPAGHEIAAATGDLDDYLVTEVLDGLPDETRQLVLATCVLSRLTPALCDALTGRTDGARALPALARSGLFLVPLDASDRWYRYHQLFAAAVRRYLARRCPELLPELHRRAADWHESAGDQREAVEHALAGDDPRVAARLLARLAEHDGGLWLEHARLSRWLGGLPEPTLAENPVLCLLVSFTLIHGSLREGACSHPYATDDPAAWLTRVDAARLPPKARALHATILAHCLFLDGSPAAAIDAAQAALDQPYLTEPGMRLQTVLRLTDPLGHGVQEGPGQRVQQECARLSRSEYDVTHRLDALLVLAQAHLCRGDLRRAMASCRESAALAAARRVEPDEHLAAAPLVMVEALLEGHRIGEAVAHALDLQAATDHHDPGVRLHGYRAAADLCLARGDEPGTLRAFDAMADYIAGTPGLDNPGFGAAARRSAAARRAYALLTFGHLAAAEHTLTQARAITVAGGEPPAGLRLYEELIAARIALAGRDWATADAIASQAMTRHADVVCAASHLRLRVVAALARQAAGDRRRALAAIAGALAQAAPGAYLRPFAEHGDDLAPLLAEAACKARQLAIQERFTRQAYLACTETVGAKPGAPELTSREIEVLSLLTEGLSAPQVGERLGLAPSTVRSHLERVYTKLGAHTGPQAVARAIRQGLLPGPVR